MCHVIMTSVGHLVGTLCVTRVVFQFSRPIHLLKREKTIEKWYTFKKKNENS